MDQPEVHLSNDRRMARIKIADKFAVLDPGQLEDLTWSCIATRRDMMPPIATGTAWVGARISVEERTTVGCEPCEEAGRVRLFLTHPGIGHVGIDMDPDVVDDLIGRLQAARRGEHPSQRD